jgi:flagellar hook-basal body complex protein FliE
MLKERPLSKERHMREISFDPNVSKVTLGTTQPSSASKASGAAFGDALKSALDGVNESQKSAESLTRAFEMEDPNVGLEDTMIAVSKANLNFQTLVQVRNRLVSAYHDIMNIQI